MLLTHTDLDRVGCGVIFGGAILDHGAIELMENGQIDERVRDVLHDRMNTAPHHAVMMTDHGMNEATTAVIDTFVRAGNGFTLLDHHRSSQQIAQRSWATVDESRSAT